jgi:hypothetical protein
LEPPPRPFVGVPPRIASFTGRTDELDRLDSILMQDKPAAVTQASVGRAAGANFQIRRRRLAPNSLEHLAPMLLPVIRQIEQKALVERSARSLR